VRRGEGDEGGGQREGGPNLGLEISVNDGGWGIVDKVAHPLGDFQGPLEHPFGWERLVLLEVMEEGAVRGVFEDDAVIRVVQAGPPELDHISVGKGPKKLGLLLKGVEGSTLLLLVALPPVKEEFLDGHCFSFPQSPVDRPKGPNPDAVLQGEVGKGNSPGEVSRVGRHLGPRRVEEAADGRGTPRGEEGLVGPNRFPPGVYWGEARVGAEGDGLHLVRLQQSVRIQVQVVVLIMLRREREWLHRNGGWFGFRRWGRRRGFLSQVNCR